MFTFNNFWIVRDLKRTFCLYTYAYLFILLRNVSNFMIFCWNFLRDENYQKINMREFSFIRKLFDVSTHQKCYKRVTYIVFWPFFLLKGSRSVYLNCLQIKLFKGSYLLSYRSQKLLWKLQFNRKILYYCNKGYQPKF